MFLAHIALAMELISMTFGALLVLACCHACRRDCAHECRTGEVADLSDKGKKCKHSYAFPKVVGYFTLVMSFLGFICTSVNIYSKWEDLSQFNRVAVESKDVPVYNKAVPSNNLQENNK